MPYGQKTHGMMKIAAKEGQDLGVHAEIMMSRVREYRNTFEDTHRRVHYCCYGARSTCPICEIADIAETACGDLIEVSKDLQAKRGIKYIASMVKNNSFLRWISSKTSTRRGKRA